MCIKCILESVFASALQLHDHDQWVGVLHTSFAEAVEEDIDQSDKRLAQSRTEQNSRTDLKHGVS